MRSLLLWVKEKGKVLGAYLLERHKTIEQFLKLIGSDTPLETELIKYSLRPYTVDQLSMLIEFVAKNEGISINSSGKADKFSLHCTSKPVITKALLSHLSSYRHLNCLRVWACDHHNLIPLTKNNSHNSRIIHDTAVA